MGRDRDREPEPDFRRMRPRRPSADFNSAPADEDDGVLYFSDCVMFPPRAGIGQFWNDEWMMIELFEAHQLTPVN